MKTIWHDELAGAQPAALAEPALRFDWVPAGSHIWLASERPLSCVMILGEGSHQLTTVLKSGGSTILGPLSPGLAGSSGEIRVAFPDGADGVRALCVAWKPGNITPGETYSVEIQDITKGPPAVVVKKK